MVLKEIRVPMKAAAPSERVLLVDDEPVVLDARMVAVAASPLKTVRPFLRSTWLASTQRLGTSVALSFLIARASCLVSVLEAFVGDSKARSNNT